MGLERSKNMATLSPIQKLQFNGFPCYICGELSAAGICACCLPPDDLHYNHKYPGLFESFISVSDWLMDDDNEINHGCESVDDLQWMAAEIALLAYFLEEPVNKVLFEVFYC